MKEEEGISKEEGSDDEPVDIEISGENGLQKKPKKHSDVVRSLGDLLGVNNPFKPPGRGPYF